MKKRIVKLNESDLEGLVTRILKEDIDSDDIIVNTLMDCTEGIVEHIWYEMQESGEELSNQAVAYKWLVELEEQAISEGFDECGISVEEFNRIKPQFLQAVIEHLNEISGDIEVVDGMDESTENTLLNMLVENVIKEEGEDQEQQKGKDNPKDVEKFLQLADKYLFSKYGKQAEKINTAKEKAMLIAALAKKWGIDTSDLSRVKSVLSTESKRKSNNRVEERIGYDSPNIMAQHSGALIGMVKSMFITLIESLQNLADNLRETPKGDLMLALDPLSKMISDISRLMTDMLDEMEFDIKPGVRETDLKSETKVFLKALNQYKRKLDVLVQMGHSYSNDDFIENIEILTTKLSTAMLRYSETLNSTDKSFLQRFQGKDRGDFGEGGDFDF